jgi:hypothetical protein
VTLNNTQINWMVGAPESGLIALRSGIGKCKDRQNKPDYGYLPEKWRMELNLGILDRLHHAEGKEQDSPDYLKHQPQGKPYERKRQ